ncbi:MAG: hypothetical protein MR332_14050 [Fusicatenibacter sp.]|nr:hypothetical protein [Fusicatenibacter sp.]
MDERTLNFLARYYGKNWDQAKYVDLLIRVKRRNGKVAFGKARKGAIGCG